MFHPFSLLLSVSLFLVLGGCFPVESMDDLASNDGVDGGTSPDAGAPDSDSPDLPPPPEPGAPVITSLLTSNEELTEINRVVVTALVSDPDGPDDIMGGSLQSPEGASYGFFVSSAPGTYSIEIDWDDLQLVEPIEFSAGASGGNSRTLVAHFFDRSGKTVQRTVQVGLRCSQGGHSACAGECVDLLANNDHCGLCGQAVGSIAGASACENGAPVCSALSDLFCNGACDDARNLLQCGACDRSCPGIAALMEDFETEAAALACEFFTNQGPEGARCQIQLRRTVRQSCESACAAKGLRCQSFVQHVAVYETPAGVTVQDSLFPCDEVPTATLPANGSTANFESVICDCRE